MKRKVEINNNSIDTAGIKKDYMAAIGEYIWNAFDANASEVKIKYDANVLCGLECIEICDNGTGIIYEDLNNTFGKFLDSQKAYNNNNKLTKGNKGKGRFSFTCFSTEAVWDTVYKKNEDCYNYRITINRGSRDEYDPEEPVKVESNSIGTNVTFTGIENLIDASIAGVEFKNYLLGSYAWFLYLNKEKKYKLFINDIELDYQSQIDSELSEDIRITIDGRTFNIFFVKWKSKINGESCYYYFLNSLKQQLNKRLTSFNHNAIDFYHSVYIVSDMFDDFIFPSDENDEQLTVDQEQNNKLNTYKKLIKELNKFVEKKRKGYVRTEAKALVAKFEDEGVLPNFADNKYEQARKVDLVSVIEGVYSVEPKIFIKLNKEQKKTFLGMLNLLLDTDERENIMMILENIVALNPDERCELSNLLKKTSLSRITNTMKLIENRYKVIELLKILIFGLDKFTTERYHIQKVIQENYWLFGEQYSLVSADEPFERALMEYLYILDGIKDSDSNKKTKYKIENQEKLKRPDVFVCRKRMVEEYDCNEIEENIIVELKEPRVILRKDVFRQVEDYRDIIMSEPRFNSQLRRWKFYIVSSKIDNFIKGQYEAFRDKGKKFLVSQINNFEIYAMTWDDVFKNFQIRHAFLYQKLEFDKSAIEEELALRGIQFSREMSDKVRDKLLELEAN